MGSIASVHRGVVTGNNRFFVRSADELADAPESMAVPIVSHAREITGDCPAQKEPERLARLISIPENLDTLGAEERRWAEGIIAEGTEAGVDKGYVAAHRSKWWNVKAPEPPAAMMTYMARRPPTFVVNRRGLPMLNVVHGIYPKQPMSEKAVERLVAYLNENAGKSAGRTYCGGLVKYEPKEAESIMVPPIEELEG